MRGLIFGGGYYRNFTVLHHITLHYIILYYIILYHIISYHIISYYVMLCSVMLCYVDMAYFKLHCISFTCPHAPNLQAVHFLRGHCFTDWGLFTRPPQAMSGTTLFVVGSRQCTERFRTPPAPQVTEHCWLKGVAYKVTAMSWQKVR